MTAYKLIKYSDLKFEPASHEDRFDPGSLKKVLFRSFDIASGVSVQMINWSRILCGRSFNPHYHEDMDEIFIILSGKVNLKVGKKEMIMESGDAVYIYQKTVHKMTNIDSKDVDYIALGLSRGKGGKSVNVE